jgi:hypothetical protein
MPSREAQSIQKEQHDRELRESIRSVQESLTRVEEMLTRLLQSPPKTTAK